MRLPSAALSNPHRGKARIAVFSGAYHPQDPHVNLPVFPEPQPCRYSGDTDLNRNAVGVPGMVPGMVCLVCLAVGGMLVSSCSARLPRIKVNSAGMELVLIPAGEFMMGSPEHKEKDAVRHLVRITSPFYIGTTEVNQAQWKAVMRTSPSHFRGENLPVESVSWSDVQEFLKALSLKEGRTYRLPTEAEWEYSCRAGSDTMFCFGDERAAKRRLREYAWYSENSDDRTHPVGQKLANAWGLYDIHGNVWEWCHDWYGIYYYKSSRVDDPKGPGEGEERVIRGGSAKAPGGHGSPWPLLLQSAARGSAHPGERSAFVGFRVVLAAE